MGLGCLLAPCRAQGIATALPPDFGSLAAIDAAGAIRPAQFDLLKDLRVWSTAFAGHSSLDGDAALGTQKVVASVAGMSFGADAQPDDGTLLGASLGVSRQTFSSAGGNGHSGDLTVALYGRRTLFDHAYVSGALGLGLHDVATRRTAPLADLRVWLTAADDVRKHRALTRDAGSFDAHWDGWQRQWLDFVANESPELLADLVIDTTR